MEITADLYEKVNFCQRCGTELKIEKDREDKVRPQCPKCGWIYYLNPIPAAACVVFNEKDELLIIKRKFEPKAGEWALPSGYIEINQTPESAACEELLEETGLIGEVDTFLDYFVGYSPLYHRIISFGFLMDVKGGQLQAGDDALEARYVSLNDLPEIAFASHRHYIEKVITLKKDKSRATEAQSAQRSQNLEDLNELSSKILNMAINVHKALGPGLLESVYEKALCCEFEMNNINYEKQKEIPISYKNNDLGVYRADIIVENSIVLELKSVNHIDDLHQAQLLSYLKLGNYKLGLLLNFNSTMLKKGIKRIIN